jgi:hypothetical protein
VGFEPTIEVAPDAGFQDDQMAAGESPVCGALAIGALKARLLGDCYGSFESRSRATVGDVPSAGGALGGLAALSVAADACAGSAGGGAVELVSVVGVNCRPSGVSVAS